MLSLTVVVPVLNEAVLLPDFLRRTTEDLETGGLDWELILVNDGSTDDSLQIMRAFAARQPRVRVIDLGVNHGPGANLMQAYQQARKQFCCYATVDRFYDTRLLPYLMSFTKEHDSVSAYRNDLSAHTPWRRVQTMLNVYLQRILFPYRFIAYHTLQIHRTDFLQSANLEARTPFLCSEMLFKASALGLRIKEVGIPYLPRAAGKATGGSPRLIARHLAEVVKYWFRWRILRQPIVSRATSSNALSRAA
jgi:glycosyltransferase involved in cell wall biosynthesis